MKELLKFITCGSVDDGKSTLIGNMLYNAKLIFADVENTLILDSKVAGGDSKIDYSLLLDGLMAEREQGITIDVAYRYFNTEKRSFIVADTPGHEEYTQNMAVGASFADLAVILVDAHSGVLAQTRRHVRICALMGIRHFVFAINKMDTVHYDVTPFNKNVQILKEIMANVAHDSLHFIPVSATKGDNVTTNSENMQWYGGACLLEYLENVDVFKEIKCDDFLMPVQRVCRPNKDFRGFQGEVVQGALEIGQEITVLPTQKKATVKQLFFADKSVSKIESGEPVTITFNEEVECARGSVIVAGKQPKVSRLIHCDVLWMDDEELVVGRNYMIKIATRLIPATVFKIHYCVDVNTGEHILRENAQKNDIINCDISLSEKIVLDAFEQTGGLGRFILVNRVTNMTAACGIIKHTLHRSDNLTWQTLDVSRDLRAAQKSQTPKTFWFTGLSGSGKSTIANAFEQTLVAMGKHTMILDGDNVRMGLNNDLGFSEQDRVENIRRIAETAKLMNDAGLIVLVSVISPFAIERQNARSIIGSAFTEIYVNTPLEECERRDVKGLYKKARRGEISNFTGITSAYEVPTAAEFTVNTQQQTINEIVKILLKSVN